MSAAFISGDAGIVHVADQFEEELTRRVVLVAALLSALTNDTTTSLPLQPSTSEISALETRKVVPVTYVWFRTVLIALSQDRVPATP